MARYGFMMRLRDERIVDQYERLHLAVDPDVLAAHSRCGIRNYSIFRNGLDLFAYFEADDPRASIERLSREPIMESWWAKTNPLMAVDANNMPRITQLPEIFFMA